MLLCVDARCCGLLCFVACVCVLLRVAVCCYVLLCFGVYYCCVLYAVVCLPYFVVFRCGLM